MNLKIHAVSFNQIIYKPEVPALHDCRGWTLTASAASAKCMTADPPFGRTLTGCATFLDPETLRPLSEGADKRREGLLIGDCA